MVPHAPPRPLLEAVIFDLDGVLVTTDTYHSRAWKRLADELELRFESKDFPLLRGVSRAESLATIYRLNSRALPQRERFEQLLSRKNGYYLEMVATMTPAAVLEGGVSVLQQLRSSGIRTAVASSSKNARLVVQRTALAPLLDFLCDGTQITAPKPDPQVFLLAAQGLGVQPRNCIGVEDAAVGITAIQRAGMVALGVGVHSGGGDGHIDSLAHLSVPWLRTLFTTHHPPA